MKSAILFNLSAACMMDSQCASMGGCCLFNDCVIASDIGCDGGRLEAFQLIKDNGFQGSYNLATSNDYIKQICVGTLQCPDILKEIHNYVIHNQDSTETLFNLAETTTTSQTSIWVGAAGLATVCGLLVMKFRDDDFKRI